MVVTTNVIVFRKRKKKKNVHWFKNVNKQYKTHTKSMCHVMYFFFDVYFGKKKIPAWIAMSSNEMNQEFESIN